MLSVSNFLKEFDKDASRVAKRLASYLESASEDNVHDLRTALRRQETRSALLPKSLRKKKRNSRYLSHYKRLFKANTKIRDLDIVRNGVITYSSLHHGNLLNQISEERSSCVRDARRIARKILNCDVMSLSPDQINESKLEKRYHSTVNDLNKRIEVLLPQVLGEPDSQDELHSLRKLCKRLRYVLEVGSEKEGRVAQKLTAWQEILGEIHDLDVILAFLENRKRKGGDLQMRLDIKKKRQTLHEKFRRIAISEDARTFEEIISS
jgi:CHAD domain-containing protein